MLNDIPEAPWIGHCAEEWEEICNPYSHWEEDADYEAEEADRRWKEEK
jgi:hypothetical protein